MKELRLQNLMCMPRQLNVNLSYNENDEAKLWFDARDPGVFEELYSYYTGQNDYMIPILSPLGSDENDSPRSEAGNRFSGARTFDTKQGPVGESQRSY